MKYYIVVETTITDPAWVSTYVENVGPLVHRYGGKYINRTGDVSCLEGEGAAPDFYSLLEFPTKEAAEKFYNCSEYEPYKQARIKGSKSKLLIVASEGGE